MAEVWIALDAAERRKNWRVSGCFTIICAGMVVAVTLSEGPGSLWWGVAISCTWLVSMTYIIGRGYGRALLTPDGIFFKGPFRRRSIPWAEITEIEKRHHTARSSEWWDLRLVRANGRDLAVPGAFTSNRYDHKFEAKLALLREYWQRAAR